MAEKETIFSSSVKYSGVFSFSEFYQFCHQWLKEEMGIDVKETKYEEKLKGNVKEIVVDWVGEKELTDYFRFDLKVSFEAKPLKNVEIEQSGAKVSTNEGSIKVAVKGTLTRDYNGKFEMTAFKKFLRSIYEKWVIKARIEEYEGKIVGMSDEFLRQAKSYLDLEGKR